MWFPFDGDNDVAVELCFQSKQLLIGGEVDRGGFATSIGSVRPCKNLRPFEAAIIPQCRY